MYGLIRGDGTNRETAEDVSFRKQLDKNNRGSEESRQEKNGRTEREGWGEG